MDAGRSKKPQNRSLDPSSEVSGETTWKRCKQKFQRENTPSGTALILQKSLTYFAKLAESHDTVWSVRTEEETEVF